MKKRFAFTTVIIAALLLLSACAQSITVQPTQTAEAAPSPAPTVQPTQTAKPQETEAEPTPEPTKEPLQVSDDIMVMLSVMDSLIRATMETGTAYAPKDDGFIWTTLYLAVVNFGEPLELAEIKDGRASAKREAVEQLGAACFERFESLPDIPETLSGAISSKNGAVYSFGLSDIGDSSTQITDVQTDGDTVKVWVDFLSWDEAQSFVFMLAANPRASENPEEMFKYSVRSVEKIDQNV